MRWRKKQMKNLDADVASAKEAARVSHERLAWIREHVIKPAVSSAQENNYATMIRESLQIGYGKK